MIDYTCYAGMPIYYSSTAEFLDNWDDLGIGIYRSPWSGKGKYEIVVTNSINLDTPFPETVANLYYIIGEGVSFKRQLVKSNITISECIKLATKGILFPDVESD